MATATLTTDERNRQTVRTVAGVRTNPGHWAAQQVHAHRTWLSDTALLTWCDLTVNLQDGGRQTTDLVSCLQCGQASYDAIWKTR